MEPNYENILKEKIDYYGETKAAYQFAAEEYAKQYHVWMRSRQADVSGLIELFEAYSKRAMRESEACNSKRQWVKGERKETESETWQEAARILKREKSVN